MAVTRKHVYDILDKEIEDNSISNETSLFELILLMQAKLDLARKFCFDSNKQITINYLRKCAAISIQAIQNFNTTLQVKINNEKCDNEKYNNYGC